MIDTKRAQGFSQPACDVHFGKTRQTGDGEDMPIAGGNVHAGFAKATGDRISRRNCYHSAIRRGTSPLEVYRFPIYHESMIKTFRCTETQSLFNGARVRRFVNIEAVARRKLEVLAAAKKLEDLRSPPGNRLEALKGDRAGQHSIRVNDQFRVCFRWNDGAENVEIVDYH